MRLRALTRLRIGFVALGAVLLAPLGFLLDAVDDRIQAQRRLRHDVVAERIFDELERELTALLESESKRPSAAYGEPTRVEAWAPFVVGYFKLTSAIAAAAPELLAQEQLDPTRTRRLLGVLTEFARTKATLGQREQQAPNLVPADADKAFEESGYDVKTGRKMPASKAAAQSSPEVLQRLNRSQDERRLKSRPKAVGPRSEDPMEGF